MAVSESVINRRNYLVEWLKPELKSIPVSIYGEEDVVNVKFQELLVCGVQVEEETYRIFNATDEWTHMTTYHCEQDDDDTWFYYVESVDECISECKRLVMFEATKNTTKKPIRTGSLIENIGEEIEAVRKQYIGFNGELCKRRKREPEYYKIYYANQWIGELWADDRGPMLWTNTVSKEDKDNAGFMKLGIRKWEPDKLYLKESTTDKGFHYTMLLSSVERIQEVVIHLIKVTKGEE